MKKEPKTNIYDIINNIDTNLMTAEKFSALVEKTVYNSNGSLNILEAMSSIVEEYEIDYSKVKRLMTSDLKQKIKNFATKQNLIEQTKNYLQDI